MFELLSCSHEMRAIKKSGLPHLPIRYLGPEKPFLELTEWYPHRMCSVPIKCAWGHGESSQHTPGYSYSIPVSIHYRPYPWEYWVSQVQAARNRSFVTRFSKFIVRHPIVGTCLSLMACGLCTGNCFIRIDERKVRKKSRYYSFIWFFVLSLHRHSANVVTLNR